MTRLPDFIGLWTHRAATTWLYSCLSEHPDIRIPIKETHFFSFYYDRGLDYYRSIFSNIGDSKKAGEFSTTYLVHPEAPERIYKYCPNAKLILSLRHPLDRAISEYFFNIRMGVLNEGVSLPEAIKNNRNYIRNGLYAVGLKNFLRFFDKKQILILIYEDIFRDPSSLIRGLYDFIGVNKDFIPGSLNKRFNVDRLPKSYLLEKIIHEINSSCERVGLNKLMFLSRATGFGSYIFKLNTKKTVDTRDAFDGDYRKKMVGYFRKDISDLESILGRNLSSWLK